MKLLDEAILAKISSEDARLMLWAIYPSWDSYKGIDDETQEVKNKLIESAFKKKLIEYAFKKKLIEKAEESDFKELINKSSLLYQNIKPSIEYTFETLLNEIATKGVSVVMLVKEMEIIARYFNLKIDINSTFFTRLKQDFNPNTEKKMLYLRLLSLWLRIQRPDIPLNYQLIYNFPRSLPSKTEAIEKSGILVAFSLRGKDISPDTVKALRDELLLCIKYLNLNKAISEDNIVLTSTKVALRLPCKSTESFALDYEDPRLYVDEIQDAFSLSHCMLVQWDFSEYSSNADLIIAIETGRFSKIEDKIDNLLTVDVPTDFLIRLSDLAYCVAISAEIKINIKKMEKYPDIWVVKSLWTFAYFETPPSILSLLPDSYEKYKIFRESLYFADKIGDMDENISKLFRVIHRFPHKITSIIEIAKALILKRMHHEAIHILSNVISFDKNNTVARTLRMFSLACLAIGENNYEIAKLFFERAINEGKYIEQYCEHHEEFYTEFGLVYWGNAQELLKRLRRKTINQAYEKVKESIFTFLKEASECFKKGFTISATGADNRNYFWWTHVNAFASLLEADEVLLKNGKMPLEDKKGIYEIAGLNYFSALGWVVKIPDSGTETKKPEIDETFLMKRMLNEIKTYLKSISSKSYLPNATYAAAAVLWDFMRKDNKTIKIVDEVLLYLEKALKEANEAKSVTPVGIYSCGASCCISIISSDDFIECVQHAIDEVKRIRKEKSFPSPMKLMLLNIERDIERDPIMGKAVQP